MYTATQKLIFTLFLAIPRTICVNKNIKNSVFPSGFERAVAVRGPKKMCSNKRLNCTRFKLFWIPTLIQHCYLRCCFARCNTVFFIATAKGDRFDEGAQLTQLTQ